MLNEETRKIKKDYIQFLNGFGLKAPENIDDICAIREIKEEKFEYNITKERNEAIKIYKAICKDFNMKPSEELGSLPTSTIWNYTLKNINAEVDKRFGEKFEKATAPNKKHSRDAIIALFDQRIFISDEDADRIIGAANDDDKIFEIYLSLGGQKDVYDPSVVYQDEEGGYVGDEDDEDFDNTDLD